MKAPVKQAAPDKVPAAPAVRADKTFVAEAIAIMAAAVILYMLRAILLPFVAAAIVAYLFSPLIDVLSRRLRIPRAMVAVLVFLLLAGLVGGLIAAALPALVAEVSRIAKDFPEMVRTLAMRIAGGGTVAFFGENLTAAQISDSVLTEMRNLLQTGGRIFLLATWGFAGVFGFFLSWVLLLYFLLGAHRIGRGLFWLVPPSRRAMAGLVWARLDPVLRRYFTGIAVVVVYACIAAYIGLGLVLGLHHAVFLALITGLLEMIPVIGPISSAIIAGLAALQQATSLGNIIAYVIYATALRLSIDQMVGPLVLGKAARVHPTLVIFCFLSGAVLLGITGIIMAVPVALTIKVVLATLYDETPTGEPEPQPRRNARAESPVRTE